MAILAQFMFIMFQFSTICLFCTFSITFLLILSLYDQLCLILIPSLNRLIYCLNSYLIVICYLSTLLHCSLWQPLVISSLFIAFVLISILCYKKHQSSCFIVLKSTYLIELGPSSTQGTCNMCSNLPSALSANLAQFHAFTEACFFPLTCFRSTARVLAFSQMFTKY